MSLSPPHDTSVLPLSLARRLDEVCCRFEADWKAVETGTPPPRFESYLTELPREARPELLRELIKIDLFHRRRMGDVPALADYRHRLPGLTTSSIEEIVPIPGAAPFNGRPPLHVGVAIFLNGLRVSELLDSRQTREAERRAAEVARADELANWLIERCWLTNYQAGRLAAGRPDELNLGEYQLLEPLGNGGMGWVMKARHRLMNRVVAVKRIRPDVNSDPATIQRFRLEMRAAARLSHPNVVAVHDAEEIGGQLILVMEFCDGITLGDLVERRGPLGETEACEYVRQVCQGLGHAHERGLVHRDLKPDNLILCGDTVKILDFGLARLSRGEESPVSSTMEGVVVGTADYISPEQTEGRSDPRSDLYSLGCTFYFLLTGRPPFPGGTLLNKCLRHRSSEPEPLTLLRPDISSKVRHVVRRLMAKKPEDRFQTSAEVSAALGQDTSTFAEARPADSPLTWPSFSRRRVLGIGIAASISLGGLIGLAFQRRDRVSRAAVVSGSSPRKWQRVGELPIPPDQAATYGLAYSLDGRHLAAAFGNHESAGPVAAGRLRVWEVARRRLVLDREIPGAPANCVAFSPDGERLVCGSGSWNHEIAGRLLIWNVAREEVVAEFEAHPNAVLGVAFQPKGDLLVTSGREGKIRLWDAKSGKPRGELTDARVPVVSLAFSPDGNQLAVGGDDGKLEVWDVTERKRLETPSPEPTHKAIRGLAFTADYGTILATTKKGQGKTANLLAFEQGVPSPPVSLGETESYCLAISPDRCTVLVGCQNGTAKLFEAATRKELQTLQSDKPFFCLAFSPAESLLATSGGWFGPVALWGPAD